MLNRHYMKDLRKRILQHKINGILEKDFVEVIYPGDFDDLYDIDDPDYCYTNSTPYGRCKEVDSCPDYIVAFLDKNGDNIYSKEYAEKYGKQLEHPYQDTPYCPVDITKLGYIVYGNLDRLFDDNFSTCFDSYKLLFRLFKYAIKHNNLNFLYQHNFYVEKID